MAVTSIVESESGVETFQIFFWCKRIQDVHLFEGSAENEFRAKEELARWLVKDIQWTMQKIVVIQATLKLIEAPKCPYHSGGNGQPFLRFWQIVEHRRNSDFRGSWRWLHSANLLTFVFHSALKTTWCRIRCMEVFQCAFGAAVTRLALRGHHSPFCENILHWKIFFHLMEKASLEESRFVPLVNSS